ncbi:MAG: hypothetical protein IJS08_07135 [Victivallales bacterium]|nr:hypothetical protein [Victivallales bacterium]
MNLKCLILMFVGIWQMTLFAAFTPEEARRVYGESSSSLNLSTFKEVGDYVFMEVKWSVDKDVSSDDRESLEMSALMDAIQKYVEPPVIACTNSPFSKALTTWLTPETEFSLPEVPSSVVKEEEKDGKHSQVIAFDATVLKAAKASASKRAHSVNERSVEDWLKLLKATYGNFKTLAEKRKFNVMLGCPIVDFILNTGKYELENANEDEKDGVSEVNRVINWTPTKDSVFSKYPNLLWSTHKKRESNLFYPNWSEDDGGRFVKAEELYRKGKDVPKILTLLAESISTNPIGEKKWAYLGGVLKAMNKPEDAMIAYIQALKFNSDDPWAWKGVRDCCKKLGFKSNAAGLDWYFKLNGIK